MDWTPFQTWLSTSPLGLVAGLLFLAMCVMAGVGIMLRERGRRAGDKKDEFESEGYIVSAVLGLLALLMGFTFSLAVDRFEARRFLVLEEANAIGTTYLRVQLLGEPHRARMTQLLIRYLDNRVALAKARPDQIRPGLAVNDALLTDIWAATSAAFPSIQGLDFSSTFLDSVNHMIDLDASRKAARQARVPAEVFAVLLVYLITAAGVLGYVLQGLRGRLSGGIFLGLLTLSLILIIDIDRPTGGGVIEGQGPMVALRQSLAAQPPAVFDRWRVPAAPTPAKRAPDKP